jgi:hypothetical protein
MTYVSLALLFLLALVVSFYIQLRRQLVLGYDYFIETREISKFRLDELNYSFQSDFCVSLTKLQEDQTFMEFRCVKEKFGELSKLRTILLIGITLFLASLLFQII